MENNKITQNAGYFILEKTENVALGFNPEAVAPFVTWGYNGNDFFWGHYYTNLQNAFDDYKERIKTFRE